MDITREIEELFKECKDVCNILCINSPEGKVKFIVDDVEIKCQLNEYGDITVFLPDLIENPDLFFIDAVVDVEYNEVLYRKRAKILKYLLDYIEIHKGYLGIIQTDFCVTDVTRVNELVLCIQGFKRVSYLSQECLDSFEIDELYEAYKLYNSIKTVIEE